MMHVFHNDQSEALRETADRRDVDVGDLISEYIAAGLESDRELTLFGTLDEVHL